MKRNRTLLVVAALNFGVSGFLIYMTADKAGVANVHSTQRERIDRELAAKKLDLVWYGGFTSVQAVRRTEGKATRVVMREEDAVFKSVFITRPDTGITKLGDLKGKTFSFGSVSSIQARRRSRIGRLSSCRTRCRSSGGLSRMRRSIS